MKASKLIACLLAAVAALALVVTRTWPGYSSFLIGAPVFTLPAGNAATGTGLGALPVRKGHYYAVSVQSKAPLPYQILFNFRDHSKSKALIVDPRLVGPDHPFQSVIKVEHDDPAAQVALAAGNENKPEQIQLARVSISELNPWLYVWRTVARVCALVVLLLASLYLLWQRRYRRQAIRAINAEEDPGAAATRAFWSKRGVARWAVVLLAVGAAFDAFFLEVQHSPLLHTPFESSISGWDGSFYYFWLRSVMVDGDVDFTNDLLYCNSMPPDYRVWIVAHTPRTKTGLIPDKYPIGWALLEVPWYVMGDLTAQLINAGGGKLAYDGFGPVYQIYLVLGQIVYATASLYFSYKILQEYLPAAGAMCGLILGWLGSPLFFYQTLDVFMSHNVMFFAMTGAYYFALRLRRRPERLAYWFLVGLLSAFVILARYQGAIMLLFPGMICLQEVGKNFRRLPSLLLAAVTGTIPLLVQMVAWKAMYGSYFLYTYQNETFSWRHPHLWEVLFSPFHGLFNWHPMMLIGFVGFLVWAVCARRYTEAVCFTLSLVLAIYINAAWDVWWFGASFGSRAFETCTLFSMLGLGYLLSLLAQRTIVFQTVAVALLLLVLWNMNFMWMSKAGRLPFEKPVTWQERLDMSVDYWSQVLAAPTPVTTTG